MTLIVGIKCADGLVMGADGAATFGALTRTIRQPVRKLTIVHDRMVVGVSGPIGLQQRFLGEIEALQPGPAVKRHQLMELLANAIRKPMKDEYAMAQTLTPTLGQGAIQAVLTGTMIGVVIQGEATLIQFDHQGSPECATDDLRFVSLGSGQSLADPFLAFLRKIFWKDKPPTIYDGVFATLWALQHAIDTNPGGVGDPIQVMTLRATKNSNCEIKELTEPDFQEHQQAIAAAEKTLANFRQSVTPEKVADAGGAIPEPDTK